MYIDPKQYENKPSPNILRKCYAVHYSDDRPHDMAQVMAWSEACESYVWTELCEVSDVSPTCDVIAVFYFSNEQDQLTFTLKWL